MPGAALGTLEMVPKLASRPDDAAALVLPDQSLLFILVSEPSCNSWVKKYVFFARFWL